MGPGQHQADGVALPPSDGAQVAGAPGKAAPLFDPSVLDDMRADFSDSAVVGQFARDFCASLEGKIDRLERRMQAGDTTGAVDGVVSVSTSAAMVGAVRLTQVALGIQRLMAEDKPDDARHSLALLRACATDTVAEIRRAVPEARSAATP